MPNDQEQNEGKKLTAKEAEADARQEAFEESMEVMKIDEEQKNSDSYNLEYSDQGEKEEDLDEKLDELLAEEPEEEKENSMVCFAEFFAGYAKSAEYAEWKKARNEAIAETIARAEERLAETAPGKAEWAAADLARKKEEQNVLNKPAAKQTEAEKFNLFFDADEGTYALDENGRKYHGAEAILQKLQEKESPSSQKHRANRLYVFGHNMTEPYAVEMNENNELLISRKPVSLKDPLIPVNHPERKFKAAASLKLEDIARMTDDSKHECLKYIYGSKLSMIKDGKVRANLEAFPAKQFKEGLKKLNKERKQKGLPELVDPDRLQRPRNRPAPMTSGEKFLHYFVKVITLGMKDTAKGNAIRAYNIANKDYISKMNAFQTDETAQKLYRDRINHLADIKNHEKGAEAAVEAVKNAKVEQEEGTVDCTQYKDQVKRYHKNMEVRLEGLRDLDKNNLTIHNMFAKVWQMKGELEGQKYTPERERALAEYLLLAALENKILADRASGEINEAVEESELKEVRSEDYILRRMSSDSFMNTVKGLNGKEIRCSALLREYVQNVNLETAPTPCRKLEQYQQSLKDAFCEQPLSEDILLDVLKYNAVSKMLEKFSKHVYPLKDGAVDTASQLYKDDHQDVKTLLSAFGAKSLDLRRIPKSYRQYIGPEVRKELRAMCKENPGKTYTLDTLCETLNKRMADPARGFVIVDKKAIEMGMSM